ncbi:uncharacterized protein LOC111780912 [Cucurbita pepo subsp. pepo]|uniref:uncharacterized protein LOC111780912 n=1 Tax=Cucurbita pepo subsp. pepo TaxID=3664 RepID=UPI000C9D8855|nr:uncharacterized protein LOC111780912 [Cucurbita pepo subsp. pepo]
MSITHHRSSLSLPDLSSKAKMTFSPSPPRLLLLIAQILTSFLSLKAAQFCRTSCGNISIHYPFGIDDGCGSLYYRNLLFCTTSDQLHLRTPSETFPVSAISYSDPYILISNPDMWNCQDGPNFRPTRPFTLDPETHLTVSPLNDYLFFNCSEEDVMIAPKPVFCGRFPDRCDASCDSASYLCTHVPQCATALEGSSCCSYHPKAMDSLKLMLKYCATYTSVYWRSIGGVNEAYDQVAEYGIRIDFDIVVTTSCLRCQDVLKGGGSCGFDVQSLGFLCICDDKNVTTYCEDPSMASGSHRHRVIAGAVSAVSAAGALGVAAAILLLKKLKAKAPVTCGVQTNENRLF